MDTGNYGADRLGGSFGKNDRMDSETNHGKNHDGDDVSLSRGSDGRDRVTVSHNGSSKSYSLNDYVSRNNSAWGSQGLSPISQAASVTRTTVTSLTGAKQTTLSGQPIEDPNNSLLSTNPDKYLEKTIGEGFTNYIDDPRTNSMNFDRYSELRNQGIIDGYKDQDRTYGINNAGNISSSTVANAASKALGPIGGMAAGLISGNIGNITEKLGNLASDSKLSNAEKAAIEHGRDAVKEEADNSKSTIADGIGYAFDFITSSPLGSLGASAWNHEQAKKAVADKYGHIGNIGKSYNESLQARHQALLDDAKRRSLDGSNQGILSQMTARLKPTTIQQQTNKMQELYDKLPSLNNLWNNIYIS